MSVVGTATSGLQASLARLDASASNVANIRSEGSLAASRAEASGEASGGPAAYQPLRVRQSEAAEGGVSFTYEPVRPSWQAAHDPASSFADDEGMIAVPNVDLAGEAVEQLVAKSDALANIAALRTAADVQGTLIDRLA